MSRHGNGPDGGDGAGPVALLVGGSSPTITQSSGTSVDQGEERPEALRLGDDLLASGPQDRDVLLDRMSLAFPYGMSRRRAESLGLATRGTHPDDVPRLGARSLAEEALSEAIGAGDWVTLPDGRVGLPSHDEEPGPVPAWTTTVRPLDLGDKTVRRADRIYYSLHDSGWDPSRALDGLAAALDDGLHEQLGFRSFREFLLGPRDRAGLSMTADEVRRLMAHRHRQGDLEHVKAAMARLRGAVADVEPVGPHGTNRGVRDTNSSDQDDSTYVIARLKRDDPDLARDVIEGRVTANAAAVRAGIRHAYARVRTDDPDRAVAVLLRHYRARDLRDAIDRAEAGGDPR